MPSIPTGKRSLTSAIELASPTIVATSDFLHLLNGRGSTVVSTTISTERSTVEWRFGDGDPEAPAIRSIFIRGAEAEAIIQEGEARILAARGLC